ncbi:MAG: peptidoglycan editing factor PgeF [Sulfuricurvum sp.]|uniref:peptidoglycan editing factor PgeF n=1 Tax=Sulfuricurvum sp. TaxID=2025608 RepID=UPI0025FBD1CF|nr:peptidoglycan editing factor PgeF [Sulfuricurvum sp.]MBV5321902.1 peptidoglycan editing factor PgeF [Sulfuricurvum sp.]
MKPVFPSILSTFTDITAAFTSRYGGISKVPYASANLAFHVGDNPEDVIQNHDLLADNLGYNRNRLIHMRQIHSDTIFLVDDNLTFDTPPECDALITNISDTPLMVMSADCTGILIYDPIQKAIGAVHAGRAGALNSILPKTIEAMSQSFGTHKEDLRIVLGPSIGGCCYEVNKQIAVECDINGYSSALRRVDEKVFLDVNTILLEQLKRLEIKNVEVIEHCTSCRCDEYFSYRAEAQRTGRLAGVIILR